MKNGPKPAAPSTAAPAKAGKSVVSNAKPAAAKPAGQPETPSSGIGLSDIADFLPGAKELLKKEDEVPTEPAAADEEPADGGKAEAENTDTEPTDDPNEDPAETDPENPDPEEPGETDGEQEATAEGDEPAAEADDEQPPADASPEWFQKRIGKMTAQKKELLNRAETAEAKTEEQAGEIQKLQKDLSDALATNVRPVPTADDPLADAMTETEVQRKVDIARQMKVWALKNPEGGTFKVGDKEYELDADMTKEHLVNADAIITELAPRRRHFLKTLEVCRTDAKRVYPDLFDKSKPDYQVLQKTLQRIPGIQSVPNYEMIIGDAIAGQRARAEKEKSAAAAKAKPKLTPKAPPKVPPRTPVPKTPVDAKSRSSSMKKIADSGGSKDALAEGVENLFLTKS